MPSARRRRLYVAAHPDITPCLACLATVHEELRELCTRVLRPPPLSRFPKLQARLREEMEMMLDAARLTTQGKLEELM